VERVWVVLSLVLASCAGIPGDPGSGEVRLPGPGLELTGRLYVPDTPGRHPAIILLHGCSGLRDARGEPTVKFKHWAETLVAQGFVALSVDSFGPRGEKEICTRVDRPIRPGRERAQDAKAALHWLSLRQDVDPERIHLIGWSNGGSTVLYAIRGQAVAGEPHFRSAVAFYPGCRVLAREPYRTSVPLLIQIGAADDWTPASYCRTLAQNAHGRQVEIDVYDGAQHSFDNMVGEVRVRPNVANANRPGGRGATVGPNPDAREKAFKRTLDYLTATR
jgi:dienelactone hydrolase